MTSKVNARDLVDADSGKVTAELNVDAPTLRDNTVVALRSGFLAFVNLYLTDGTEDTFLEYDFQRNSADWAVDPRRRAREPGVFSKEYDRLFDAWVINPKALGADVNWLRNTLRVVKTLLSPEGSFYRWCVIQGDNPFASMNHLSFLTETLAFIAEGKPRRLSLGAYRSVLVKSNTFLSAASSKALIAKAFDTSGLNLSPVPRDTDSLITKWLSRENGLGDMLTTLHIIFGEASEYRVR